MHIIICIKQTATGANMRMCKIYPIHAGDKHGFKWEWRSEGCERRSSRKFDFFYDCMEDARSHGFRVILPQPTGDTAPAHYSLLQAVTSSSMSRSTSAGLSPVSTSGK